MASSKFPEPLLEVTDFESPRVEATTLNPIPQNIPNRLSDLLSHLPKLNLVDPIRRPLETFTLFPNLPSELRLKIWNYSSRQSRTLLLSDTWFLERINPKKLQTESIENNNKVPAVLHTCSEARQEGLKNYTECAKRCSHNFYNKQIPGYTCENQACVNKHVYVNFNVDRFLCRNFPAWGLLDDYQLDKKDLALIQFIDFECDNSCILNLGLGLILLAERLKEINIVDKKQAGGWESLLPTTIDKELPIIEYKKTLMNCIEREREKLRKERRVSSNEEDEGRMDWQFRERVEVACKWSWVGREDDLVPISAGASAGYFVCGW